MSALSVQKPLRDELIEDVVHVLRLDHGHTTAHEMFACRTCTRRAELVVDRMLRTLDERDAADELPGLSDPHADPTATPMSAEADVKYRPLKES